MSKSKFQRGERVRVGTEFPADRYDPRVGFSSIAGREAIIACNRVDAPLGPHVTPEKQYMIMPIKEDGTGEGSVAWYWEQDLALVSDDRAAGEQILSNYEEMLREERSHYR